MRGLRITAQPPDFRAGTAVRYSNTGYILLGLVFERATGQPLARLLENRIVRPLGLSGTWLSDGREPAGGVVSGLRDHDQDGKPEDYSAASTPSPARRGRPGRWSRPPTTSRLSRARSSPGTLSHRLCGQP